MAEKYDAVVIGAGLGGLSAATFLARNGKEVLLLERHNLPGGYATSFCRGRFEFDISLHELSGIGIEGERGSLYNYLDSIGVAEKIEFITMNDMYRVLYNQIDLTIPSGRDKSQEFITQHFPKEAEGIEGYFDAMRDLTTEYFDVIAAASMRSDDMSPEKFPTFMKYGMKTYGEVLDEFIKDEDLKNVLSPYWGYAGLPPTKLPFQLMAVIWESYLDTYPHHIRGKSQALSNAFIESFLESGGTVKFNQGAKKIIVKDGFVTGVVTDDGEEVKTGVVVSNASPLSTMVDLVGVDDTPKEYMKDIHSRLIGFATVNIYIGLDCPAETLNMNVHENFIMTGDIESEWERCFTLEPPEGFLFTCYNATDPKFSPEGTSVVVLTNGAYARPWYAVPPHRYVDVKNSYADGMLDVAERHFPGFRDHIEVIEVATPITNMRYTGNPGGTIYGTDQYLSDSGLLRLRHKAPIDGLFFASAWTIPGGGYQPTISSGAIAGGRALGKLS